MACVYLDILWNKGACVSLPFAKRLRHAPLENIFKYGIDMHLPTKVLEEKTMREKIKNIL